LKSFFFFEGRGLVRERKVFFWKNKKIKKPFVYLSQKGKKQKIFFRISKSGNFEFEISKFGKNTKWTLKQEGKKKKKKKKKK